RLWREGGRGIEIVSRSAQPSAVGRRGRKGRVGRNGTGALRPLSRSMNRDSETRMTNDEIRMNDEIRITKPATAQLRAIAHSGFGFVSSLVIGHWSFNDYAHQVHGPNAR